jgi:translation initiation factor IF-3
LRVLDQFNKQLGVMTRDEALKMSRETGMDLVEIAGKAVPPVAKLIEFSKFKYQQQQKQQEEKKKAKIAEIKELRLTPVIAQGDFDSRMKKSRKYLEDGDKVRLVVKFQGRMITHKEFGERVLQKAVAQLADISMVEIQPRLLGKFMSMQLSPVKKKKVKVEPAQSTQVAPQETVEE